MTARSRPRNPDDKICATCGRPFSWRRRWKDHWSEVRYCGAACRRRRPGRRDRELERSILDLLAGRSASASICPSEAARRLSPDGWRPLMEPARRAARRLAQRGEIEIVQAGRAVDPGRFRGPVRLRRRR